MSDTLSIYPGWSVRPVAGRIGAEISGVRLDGVTRRRYGVGKHGRRLSRAGPRICAPWPTGYGIHTNDYDYAAVRPAGREDDRRHHAEVFALRCH
jgi:hypothetical protein